MQATGRAWSHVRLSYKIPHDSSFNALSLHYCSPLWCFEQISYLKIFLSSVERNLSGLPRSWLSTRSEAVTLERRTIRQIPFDLHQSNKLKNVKVTSLQVMTAYNRFYFWQILNIICQVYGNEDQQMTKLITILILAQQKLWFVRTKTRHFKNVKC
jgi:hypothetical protein